MKKTWINLLITAAVTLVATGIFFYITLPAINVFSQGFWISIILVIALFALVYSLLSLKRGFAPKGVQKKFFDFSGKKTLKICIALAIIPVLVLVVGGIASSEFFNASAYSSIIEVPEAVFEDDMPEMATVSNIALMDTATAQKMGDRTLGALSDVVSQYQVNPDYKQINYKQTPQKLASLEYADFFKWLSNRDNGIPGYVMVDPVNVTEAKYIKFSQPIKYTQSAFFGDNLGRKIRFSYPTKIFGNTSFEIDDEGNPYYIVSCMSPKIFMFGAFDVNEVIIFNPVDGSSQLYALADVPSWVDNVFTGDQASQKYDWYGTLKNGFWNSVIGNKDCKVTTDDYGYIVLGDDVWFFTGVTSVTADESKIGFIISNARTGQYKFYPVSGAEEYSAMESAQGKVQEKGYVASFPSLVNIAGEPTYIMVLKDANGIVRLYAFVNVKQYTVVSTGETQAQAKAEYIRLLKEQNIIKTEPEAPAEELPSVTVDVLEARLATIGGNSVLYITGSDGMIYKKSIAEDEALMAVFTGDKLTISYRETDVAKIRQIATWSFAAEAE